MKIAIYGTGGVGGYYGGRLAEAGEDVVFIARGAHLEALRRGGLRLTSPLGDALIAPVQATDDPAAVGPVDAVIVAVKTWQLEAAAEAMRPLLGPHTAVLPLLNGVEAAEVLSRALGPGHVLGGLAKIISAIAGPGHIDHLGAEPYIALAEWDGQPSDRARALAAALRGAGIRVDTPDDIQAALWEKFLFVVGYGAVGALARVPLGELRALPRTRALLAQSMSEIHALASARGVALRADVVERNLRFIDGLPAAATTSLQRDIAEGRPSELEAWGGAVVRLAEECGLEVPLHQLSYALLLPQERAARRAAGLG